MTKPKTTFPTTRNDRVADAQPGTSSFQALRQAIHDGDRAYAQGQFTRYDAPGQLAANLKAALLRDVDPSHKP